MTASKTAAPSTVDDLIAATVEARQAIRDLHGATKDLRQLIAQAKKLPGTVTDELVIRMAELSRAVHDGLDAHEKDLTIKLTEGIPVNMLCSGCGAILSLMMITDRPFSCAQCGHQFMIRSET
jgi:DNA-directed RNA polymerase subunit RPC12/RpoP